MYPAVVAAQHPDRPALVIAETGQTMTYRQLASGANRLARLFRARGLSPGAHLAVYLANHIRYMEIVWACHISGIRVTPINAGLTASEAAYIVKDSSAELVISDHAHGRTASELREMVGSEVATWLLLDGRLPGWESFEDTVGQFPDTPITDMCQGGYMFYSSGTTGRPKGIEHTAPIAPLDDLDPRTVQGTMALVGAGRPLTGHQRFLVPGPLYFSAASNFAVIFMRAGATLVIMQRFDPAGVLRFVEQYGITVAQFVPTHFTRMLALPDAVRAAADMSTLQAAFHAGAPCPEHVKRAMLAWWGPIISEYYAASEGIGLTWITSEEWLRHPGSVGRPVTGTVHILDPSGQEVPANTEGEIWFEGGPGFRYRNVAASDTPSTAEAKGWSTVGDLGHVDHESYLYLTDRKAYTIISGGVNIYPQEIENRLAEHPAVADVAVFGVPNADFGEEVKAVVQPVDWATAGPDLAAELESFCRQALAGYKIPRSIDFDPQLPRQDTGKLLKRIVRERYLDTIT